MTNTNSLFKISIFIPCIFTVTLLLFYFHTAIKLGSFPSFSNPDPKDIDLYCYYNPVITIALTACFINFVFGTIALIIFLQHHNWKTYKPLIFYTAGAQAMSLLLMLSPIMKWYID